MPQTTFVLKEPTSLNPTLVYLIFRFNGNKMKYSTGQKIAPKFWNPERYRAKETRQFLQYPEFNSLLINLENCVNNAYRKLVNDQISPTSDGLKVELNKFLQKGEAKTKDLIGFAEFIVSSTDRQKGTKKQLRQAIRNLKEFKQATNRSLHFDSIDIEFYDEFTDFLIKKNYARNTIGTLIKNLKVFMNEAIDRKLTNNLQFRNKRFKTVEEPSETIYLNEKELKKLNNLDLSKDFRLDKVRDLFIIGCYTGLRFSDLASLRKENVTNDGTQIKVTTQKTGEVVIIPIKGIIKRIFEKYNWTPPDVISNQKMNEYLKELGKLAEISDDVIITFTKGGKRQSKTYSKWELITTHTARRSFATNAYLQNVPPISIMKLTGHKTEKSFMKYIKISQEDNAIKLNTHPFFK